MSALRRNIQTSRLKAVTTTFGPATVVLWCNWPYAAEGGIARLTRCGRCFNIGNREAVTDAHGWLTLSGSGDGLPVESDVMIVRISSSSERKPTSDIGGRFDVRLSDGGWLVFDTETGDVAVVGGQRLRGLKESRARARAQKLNSLKDGPTQRANPSQPTSATKSAPNGLGGDALRCPLCGEDGVIGRPSLWIAEDLGCCASG